VYKRQTVRGTAADTLAGGEPAGGVATQSNSAAVARHDNKDVELPRIGNDCKPDITNERAPTTAEVTKHAPKFNTDNVPVNDEQPEEGKETPGTKSARC
jgi:hypothetical protein